MSSNSKVAVSLDFRLKLECLYLNFVLANIVYRKALFISFPTIPHSGSKVQWESQKMYPREASRNFSGEPKN